eukprot:scaffold1400_cov137-Cylindrotheca_fusiformis.AAC.7
MTSNDSSTLASVESIPFGDEKTTSSFSRRSSGTGSLIDETSSSSWSIRRSSGDNHQFNPEISHRSNLRDHKNVRELTINKLNFKAIHICGREHEIETLRTCIDRATMKEEIPKKKELILIEGYSGIGKSMLASTVEEHVASTENGVLARGKYGLNSCDEPYSGLSDAFGLVCTKLKQASIGENTLQKLTAIGDAVSEELGSDSLLLLQLVPELDGIIDNSFSESSSQSFSSGVNNNHDFEASFEKLKYVLRVFTRILCTYVSPLVLVLDDLQWADVASLKVVEFLLSDFQNSKGLVIMGLYRSNELTEADVLFRTISNVNENKEAWGVHFTKLHLQGLGLDDVNRIVMSLLSIDSKDTTLQLAELCYRRTLGNPFFLIEFVKLLEREGWISFSLGACKWKWDVKDIEKNTVSTMNVVDLVRDRMQKLPRTSQLLLQYAACLGSSFTLPMIHLIWTQHSDDETDKDIKRLRKIFATMEAETLIERCGGQKYQWVHDKVQEAALLIGYNGDKSFLFEVGMILHDSLGSDELEEVLFEVVDLLNKGSETKNPEYAMLNLRAAEKAREISAFRSAASYISRGILFLPDDKWTTFRGLTLRLFSLGVEMEVALGRDEVFQKYRDEVLSQEGLSALEKLPTYIAQSHKLSNVAMDHNANIELSLAVLKELGITLPSNPITVPPRAICCFLRTVKRAKNTPKEEYKSPKRMRDPRLQAGMLFLSRLFYASFFTANKFMLVLSACKMVQLTLNHGVSPLSGQAYASLGMIVNAILHDFNMASFFAETGLLIQSTTKSNYMKCQTMFLASHSILAWTRPLQTCHLPLVDVYTLGMRSGNIEYAMWGLLGYNIFLPYVMGKPLSSIEPRCAAIVSQMEDLQQNDQAVHTRKWWQLILNLLGRSADPLVLSGTAFDVNEFVPRAQLQVLFLNFTQAELNLFYGCNEKAADSALARQDEFANGFGGHLAGMQEAFHRGVALYAMARRTKRRKYKAGARHIRNIVRKWFEDGNPNVRHYHIFLGAEHAALKRNDKAAKSLYEESIRTAARTGHLQHAGLFNERYADFFRFELKDEEEARYRIDEAIRWYTEWGAEQKVEMLRAMKFTHQQ